MKVEDLDDILSEIADKAMIYGACKSEDDGGCEFSTSSTFCCRVGFMFHYEDRIRQAMINEEKLSNAGY